MAKMLMVHPDRCVGCQVCAIACAFAQEGSQRREAARIHVFSWRSEGVSVPMVCQQCGDAACVAACPTGAMHRNPVTAQVELTASRCIRCRMCTSVCPFGNCVYDALTDSIIKCDACQGDPACVQMCPSDALEYVDDTVSTRSRQREFALKLRELLRDYPA